MVFFQRLFAVYYLMLIKQRRSKFLRKYSSRTEDFSAMVLVIIVQLFLVFFILLGLKDAFQISILIFPDQYYLLNILIYLGVFSIWIYFGNRYFLSNRARSKRFIEDFRVLEKGEKIGWNVAGITFLLTPVWMIFFRFLEM